MNRGIDFTKQNKIDEKKLFKVEETKKIKASRKTQSKMLHLYSTKSQKHKLNVISIIVVIFDKVSYFFNGSLSAELYMYINVYLLKNIQKYMTTSK